MEPSQPDVFHAGEQAVQDRLGVRDKVARFAHLVIRDHMPDQHREFFAQLPFVILGAVDTTGQPWASLLAGPPGFMASPDPLHLVIGALPPDSDPLRGLLAAGTALGLLGIEPHTRRRNRMNGVIEHVGEGQIGVRVSQSFGNCPKYIQARKPEWVAGAESPLRVVHRSDSLDARAQEMIRAADTFFIASAHPAGDRHEATQGADVSHRGGKPGFVRVDGAATFTVPDFVGNYLFNTLGNLMLNPRAGLLFPDFETGERLYVAVSARVVWDGPEVEMFKGAQRLLRFEVREVRRVADAPLLRWGAAARSPFLDATGCWP
ncbi:MAG: pyridoxamine 5'-phosphate oxidase family protein [Panacagrimonas sp.]